MLMMGPNAGLLSSLLPSCATSTHFYHYYGNGLLSMVAQWLAGQWVGGGDSKTVGPKNIRTAETAVSHNSVHLGKYLQYFSVQIVQPNFLLQVTNGRQKD